MKKSKIVYIASPYAGDVDQNVRSAIEACKYAIERGCAPIAPHLMYPQILDYGDTEQRKLGLELGKRLIAAADELWICGERGSEGMYAEIIEAITLGIPQRRVMDIPDAGKQ
jgi:hypothetical protein